MLYVCQPPQHSKRSHLAANELGSISTPDSVTLSSSEGDYATNPLQGTLNVLAQSLTQKTKGPTVFEAQSHNGGHASDSDSDFDENLSLSSQSGQLPYTVDEILASVYLK